MEIFTLCLKFLFSLLRTKMKQAKHLMCNIVCLRETGFVYSLLVQRCFNLFLYISCVFVLFWFLYFLYVILLQHNLLLPNMSLFPFTKKVVALHIFLIKIKHSKY